MVTVISTTDKQKEIKMLYILSVKSGARRIARLLCDDCQLAASLRAIAAAGLSYDVWEV